MARAQHFMDGTYRTDVSQENFITCNPATSETLADLDNQCLARRIGTLRVVDFAVSLTSTNRNLNAPTIVVAEKPADLILGCPPLKPADVPVWIHPDFETLQR